MIRLGTPGALELEDVWMWADPFWKPDIPCGLVISSTRRDSPVWSRFARQGLGLAANDATLRFLRFHARMWQDEELEP